MTVEAVQTAAQVPGLLVEQMTNILPAGPMRLLLQGAHKTINPVDKRRYTSTISLPFCSYVFLI